VFDKGVIEMFKRMVRSTVLWPPAEGPGAL